MRVKKAPGFEYELTRVARCVTLRIIKQSIRTYRKLCYETRNGITIKSENIPQLDPSKGTVFLKGRDDSPLRDSCTFTFAHVRNARDFQKKVAAALEEWKAVGCPLTNEPKDPEFDYSLSRSGYRVSFEVIQQAERLRTNFEFHASNGVHVVSSSYPALPSTPEVVYIRGSNIDMDHNKYSTEHSTGMDAARFEGRICDALDEWIACGCPTTAIPPKKENATNNHHTGVIAKDLMARLTKAREATLAQLAEIDSKFEVAADIEKLLERLHY